MIEKHIVLEDIDPVIFYGVNNANIQMIKALYPKLRIVARGNVIKVMGDEEEMCAFEESIIALEKHCVKYNSLKEEVIIDIIKGKTPQIEKTGDTIVFSVTGKPIVPRSENQFKLVKEYEKKHYLVDSDFRLVENKNKAARFCNIEDLGKFINEKLNECKNNYQFFIDVFENEGFKKLRGQIKDNSDKIEDLYKEAADLKERNKQTEKKYREAFDKLMSVNKDFE